MADGVSIPNVSLDLLRKMIAAGEREAAALGGIPIRPLPPRNSVPGYEILRELGRGGMGVVYQAHQLSTKRTVALKVLLAGEFASASAQARFQREIELTARLQHEGIVRVFESGFTLGGQQYYAMDYVEAAPLNRWLTRARPPVREVLATFIGICEAIEHAHQHGVIHRDLKPGNVLVGRDGRPHVLDFGLAKAVASSESAATLAATVSSPGQVLGTLRYLSPEQAAGRPEAIDARTDVYALGVMLFEALTESPPYGITGHPSAVTQRILETPPARPSSLSDRVDGELETIILKTLEKEQDRRYQTAKELSEDLERYLSGEPILANPPSRVYRLRKKLSRHRVGLARLGAALAIAALAAVIGIRWWHHRLEDEQARALAEARQTALELQEALEKSPTAEITGQATYFYSQHPTLPESFLLWAQASFRAAQAAGNDAELRGTLGSIKLRCEDNSAHWAVLALAADLGRALGDNARAETLAKRARAATPDTAEGWYLLSFATTDLREAERCAWMAVRREPEHPLAWQRLAGLRLRAGDLEGAVEAADRLIEHGGDIPKWLCFQGRVLTQARRYRDAVERFARAVELAPNRTELYRARGIASLCLRDYASAGADYSRSMEVKKPIIWLHYMRATPLWMSGELDKAAADYREFRRKQIPGSFADARLYLILIEQARVHELHGQADEARNLRREAEEVLQSGRSATNPGEWLDRVLACVGGELSPEELVSHADPTRPGRLCEAYYYAGEACLLRGDPAQARTLFEQCVQTDLVFEKDSFPPNPMNEYHLALWRLEQLGGPQEELVPPPATTGAGG